MTGKMLSIFIFTLLSSAQILVSGWNYGFNFPSVTKYAYPEASEQSYVDEKCASDTFIDLIILTPRNYNDPIIYSAMHSLWKDDRKDLFPNYKGYTRRFITYHTDGYSRTCYDIFDKPRQAFETLRVYRVLPYNSAFMNLWACYYQLEKFLSRRNIRFTQIISETKAALFKEKQPISFKRYYFYAGEVVEWMANNHFLTLHAYVTPQILYDWFYTIQGLELKCGAAFDLNVAMKKNLHTHFEETAHGCIKTMHLKKRYNNHLYLDSVLAIAGKDRFSNLSMKREKFILSISLPAVIHGPVRKAALSLSNWRKHYLLYLDGVHEYYFEDTFPKGKLVIAYVHENDMTLTYEMKNLPFNQLTIPLTNSQISSYKELVRTGHRLDATSISPKNFYLTLTYLEVHPLALLKEHDSKLVLEYFMRLVENFGCNIFFTDNKGNPDYTDMVSESRFRFADLRRPYIHPLKVAVEVQNCKDAYLKEYEFLERPTKIFDFYKRISVTFVFPFQFKNLMMKAFAHDVLKNPLFITALEKLGNIDFSFSSGIYTSSKNMQEQSAHPYMSKSFHMKDLTKLYIPDYKGEGTSDDLSISEPYDQLITGAFDAFNVDTFTAYDKQIVIAFGEETPEENEKLISKLSNNKLTNTPKAIIVVTPASKQNEYVKAFERSNIETSVIYNFNNLGVALAKEIGSILSKQKLIIRGDSHIPKDST